MTVVIRLLIGGLLGLFDGWVLLKLWAWFLVPIGAPAINYWQALGLDLCLGYVVCFTYQPTMEVVSSQQIFITTIVRRVILLLLLMTGFILTMVQP